MTLWESILSRLHPREEPRPSPPQRWADRDELQRASRRATTILLPVGAGTADEAEEPDLADVDEREYADAHHDETVREVRRVGMEAVAFYAPIHYYGGDKWGIYVLERRFWGLCAELARIVPSAPWDLLVADLLSSLERHETLHAGSELLALISEDHYQLREWSKHAASGGTDDAPAPLDPPLCQYVAYCRDHYEVHWPDVGCLEETLATACQMRGPFRARGLRSAMSELLSGMPPAYARWASLRERQAYSGALQQHATAVLGSPQLKLANALNLSWQLWFPDPSTTDLDSYGPIPRWICRQDHRAPRRLMRAVLGNVRTADFVRCLQRAFSARVVAGAKHGAVSFPNGHKVPYSASWPTIPNFFVGQVARALGVARSHVLSICT